MSGNRGLCDFRNQLRRYHDVSERHCHKDSAGRTTHRGLGLERRGGSGTPPRCSRSSIIGRSVAAALSRPSSSDASPQPEPRASTCVGYSDSRSSATSTKSYRLSLPKKRRWEAREKQKQPRSRSSATIRTLRKIRHLHVGPRDAREIYPPATVCYCTKNEGTPSVCVYVFSQ